MGCKLSEESIKDEGKAYAVEAAMGKLTGIDSRLEMQHPHCESIYVGASWDSISDEETGKQFKDKVEASVRVVLHELGIPVPEDRLKFESHEEAWYDG